MTAPYVPGPPQPQYGSPATTPAPPAKKRMGTGLIVFLALVGLCALFGIIGAIATAVGGDQDPAAPAAAATTAAAPAAPTPAAPAATIPAAAPRPPGIYQQGILIVPTEVPPGTYRATVPTDSANCYWARLKGTSGTLDDILANGNGDPGQRVTVTIRASDKAFETTGCGDWIKIG